jgi:hypothetical protein
MANTCEERLSPTRASPVAPAQNGALVPDGSTFLTLSGEGCNFGKQLRGPSVLKIPL